MGKYEASYQCPVCVLALGDGGRQSFDGRPLGSRVGRSDGGLRVCRQRAGCGTRAVGAFAQRGAVLAASGRCGRRRSRPPARSAGPFTEYHASGSDLRGGRTERLCGHNEDPDHPHFGRRQRHPDGQSSGDLDGLGRRPSARSQRSRCGAHSRVRAHARHKDRVDHCGGVPADHHNCC